jgi:hypothetical protein
MPDEERDDAISERAELLPEERVAGSEDPEGQAAAILDESEDRTFHREPAKEHRTSDDVVEPPR